MGPRAQAPSRVGRVSPRGQHRGRPNGRCSLSQGHQAPRIWASWSVPTSHYWRRGSAADLAECLRASHSLPEASVSPSAPWELGLGGPQGPFQLGHFRPHEAAGLQILRPPITPGSRGQVGGRAVRGRSQPPREGASSPQGRVLHPVLPASHFQGAPRALSRLILETSLPRRHTGQGRGQSRVQIPLGMDKPTPCVFIPHQARAWGLSHATRVKHPPSSRQECSGGGPGGSLMCCPRARGFWKSPFKRCLSYTLDLSSMSCLPRESILGANYTAGSALGERGAWGQPTRETT